MPEGVYTRIQSDSSFYRLFCRKPVLIPVLCAFLFLLAPEPSAYAFESSSCSSVSAPATIRLVLKDATTGEPVPYATVSLHQKGRSDALQYTVSTPEGSASLSKVPIGSYTLKVELMGYKTLEKEIEIGPSTGSSSGHILDLGELLLSSDVTALEASRVSAVASAMEFDRDTVSYNASSFVLGNNDLLEDLLKKLPGVEIGDDGSITVNGESVTRMTIDGKTFFLDDPTVASRNILAKYIKKIKVVTKKSDMAEFTGIDDGETETVIDLSVHESIFGGLFGNTNVGLGHDVPSSASANDKTRYQASAFVGSFSRKRQLSLVLNTNDVNMSVSSNLGSSSSSTSDTGETTSYTAGLNGAWTLDESDSELGANYIFNKADKLSAQNQSRMTYLPGSDLLYSSREMKRNMTVSNKVGARLDWKISERSQLRFEPAINLSKSSSNQGSEYTTDTYYSSSEAFHTNEGSTDKISDSKGVSTSGKVTFKQRLGLPGRILIVNANYSFSDNGTDGLNFSGMKTFSKDDPSSVNDSILNQTYNQKSNSANLYGKVSYTEPLGGGLYLEGNYSYRWNRSFSSKDTYSDGVLDPLYSNDIRNIQITQKTGANLKYQVDKFIAQVGVSLEPSSTRNRTVRNGSTGEYSRSIVNWAPVVSVNYDPKRGESYRVRYSGQSSQPSVSQLMPVLDLTNQTNLSFGNPYLCAYFTHSARIEAKKNNSSKGSSYNVKVNGSFVQNPIVSAIWTGSNGVQYSMPVNGKASKSISANTTINYPIGKTGLSIRNTLNGSFSSRCSFVGNGVLTEDYYSEGEFDYGKFHSDHLDMEKAKDFLTNTTNSMSLNEQIKLRVKMENFEMSTTARTRINKSWYTVGQNSTDTRTNSWTAYVNWNFRLAGISTNSTFTYRWYEGFTSRRDPEAIWNAEISKAVIRNLTVSVIARDILSQQKSISISDTSNQHRETVTNTLGRYVLLSVAYNFGKNPDEKSGRGSR